MTTDRVKWGVLGTADIAVRLVIPAMQRGALSHVMAIASRDPEKARTAAKSFGIERAYGSYDELLADPDVEVVYNPLPNHLHVPWSIRAADAGKHVLCEKPIALSAAEARELQAAAALNSVIVAEAFMVRAHPQWLRVHDLVQSGRIGDLRLIVGHFSYYRRDPDDIRSRVDWGGGALMDIGCYPITIARWLFGAEPIDVLAQIDRDPEMQIDRLVSGLMRFDRGQAAFTCAGQLVPYQRMHIFGTHGRIEVEIPFNAPNDRPTRVFVDDGGDLAGQNAETIEIPAADQYLLQGERFSEAVRGIGAVPSSVENAIHNMAVIDALFRSADSGRWERP